MKTVRWIIAFPVAFAVSAVAWITLSSVFRSTDGSALGHLPILIRIAIPTVLFVVSAVFVCPSRERRAAFIFFAAAILCSGGEIELLRYYELGNLSFWMTTLVAVNLGALSGLLLSLRFQCRRNTEPNQALEPTLTVRPSSTP
jgi:hypothetical protein